MEGKRKIFPIFGDFNRSEYVVDEFHLYVGQAMQYALASAKGLPMEIRESFAHFFAFKQKYSNLITLVSLPLFALCSKVLYASSKYNYGEHLTILVFGLIQVYLVNTIFMLMFIIFPSTYFSIYYILPIIICCYAVTLMQVFKESRTMTLLKSLLIFGLGYSRQILLSLVALYHY